jgi:hypothetical protein
MPARLRLKPWHEAERSQAKMLYLILSALDRLRYV